jgi:Transposase and inactivated derivatives
MLQSISDVLLFKCPEDKDMYLKIMKKYQEIFMFKIYAYCLMDTYVHLIIDCNGADISRIMHSINQNYAQCYNNKYKRHGPLFYGRFNSRIINGDDILISTSAYINKIRPEEFEGSRKAYKYSSSGIYAGTRRDELGLLDTSFIFSIFDDDVVNAKKQYLRYVRKFDEGSESDEMSFRNEKPEYRSEKHVLFRDVTPDDVIDFVARYTKTNKIYIRIKYVRETMDMKCLSAFLMRCLCDLNEKDICRVLGNVTQNYVSRLCFKASKLIESKPEYRNIIDDFLTFRTPDSSCSMEAVSK